MTDILTDILTGFYDRYLYNKNSK